MEPQTGLYKSWFHLVTMVNEAQMLTESWIRPTCGVVTRIQVFQGWQGSLMNSPLGPVCSGGPRPASQATLLLAIQTWCKFIPGRCLGFARAHYSSSRYLIISRWSLGYHSLHFAVATSWGIFFSLLKSWIALKRHSFQADSSKHLHLVLRISNSMS